MPKRNPLNSGKPIAFGIAQRYGDPERIWWGHQKRATTHSASRTQAAGYALMGVNTAGVIWESLFLLRRDVVWCVRTNTHPYPTGKRPAANLARTKENARRLCAGITKKETAHSLLRQERMVYPGTETKWHTLQSVNVAPQNLTWSSTILMVTEITTQSKTLRNYANVVTKSSTDVQTIYLHRKWLVRLALSSSVKTGVSCSGKTENSNVLPRYSLTLREIVGQSIAYGMMVFSLYERLNEDGFPINLEDTEKLFNTYCKEFSTGVSFLRRMGKMAVRDGYLVNLNGRRRYWPKPNPEQKNKEGLLVFPKGRLDPKYRGILNAHEREGGNFLIQAVNADITKLAMYLIRQHIIKNKVRSNIMMQVYDEIVTDTHKHDSPDFVIEKRRLMVAAAEKWITTVPFEVEGNIMGSWTK